MKCHIHLVEYIITGQWLETGHPAGTTMNQKNKRKSEHIIKLDTT
jgi:hypothetical protein